jgi:uncharacterized protein (TIGR03435 family)
MRALLSILAILAAATPERRFEAASIRPHPLPAQGMAISTSGLRLTTDATTVEELILYAFDLRDYQLSGSFDAASYDIVARAEGDALPTEAEFRLMMRTLLAERFGLRLHRERKQIPVYELVVGKNGPKLKKSEGPGDCSCESGPKNAAGIN